MDAPEFYTTFSTLYDALARHGPGVGRLREALADALAPAPGDTVVELGCGTGANHPHFRDLIGPAGRYVGVDFSPGVLDVASDRERAAGAAFVRADATRPPIRSASVDACCSAFVSGMLAEPAAAVRTWADLVGPGGRLALLDLARTTRPGWRLLNPGFRLFVRLGSPPGGANPFDGSPTARLDERVAAAHRELGTRCSDVTTATLAGGFARVSAGTVR
ncbi:class I SAM-dependent methyltransferase [Halorarum halobium]|uniref:class I SAM-dependent methyltransferase n=1 Tax=Halorarum halobium TaxID=3075121 RepID=UPI0028AEE053|nr:methyltransferase domain-containing protein [Halobaculum sp. XH14]